MSKTSQPSANDLPPTCNTCKHFNYIFSSRYCYRESIWEPVQDWVVNTRSAWVERKKGWFGQDRCGPDGKYWEKETPATPPFGVSGVRPPRPSR